MNAQTASQIFMILVVAIQTFHGVAMPILIDMVNQHVANSRARQIIAVVLCVVVASALNLPEVLAMRDISDAAMVVGKISFIFLQAQIVYKQFYEKSDTRVKLYGRGIIS